MWLSERINRLELNIRNLYIGKSEFTHDVISEVYEDLATIKKFYAHCREQHSLPDICCPTSER